MIDWTALLGPSFAALSTKDKFVTAASKMLKPIGLAAAASLLILSAAYAVKHMMDQQAPRSSYSETNGNITIEASGFNFQIRFGKSEMSTPYNYCEGLTDAQCVQEARRASRAMSDEGYVSTRRNEVKIEPRK